MHNPYEAPREALFDEPRPRPTWARFGVLSFLCTMAVLLYIDRVCIGQAKDSIRDELKLTDVQMSWVLNAFIISYCLFEVPTGHLADRFGSRGVIARIVVVWSIFTALTGLAFGLWSLVIVRFLFGAGEAGAFPNAARVVTRWFPAAERGLARGAISTTSLVGGAFAPPLAAFLIGLVGWRWTFAVFGALGLVWAAAFYYWFRDEPADHSAVNEAEREHIGPPEIAQAVGAHAAIPWGRVLLSPNVWLLGTIQMVSATLFYMQFQWFPSYLKESRGLSEQTAAWFTSIVIFGGAAGCLVGGVFSDWIIRHMSDRKWSRRFCGGGSLILSAAALWGTRYCEDALPAALLNATALFLMQISIPTWWTVVAEISGRHGAALWGLMNSMGGLGVFTMNFLVAYIVQIRKAQEISPIECWRPVFDGVAIALAFGAACWLFVDATRSIVEPAGKDSSKPSA